MGLGSNALEELVWWFPNGGSYCILPYGNVWSWYCVQADLASRKLLANRPMSLRRVDGHALWVSQAALDETLTQIPGGEWPDNEDIVGGEIIRDADGQPTGVFVDNAIPIVRSPPWTPEQMENYLERAMSDALAVGLTTVHDAFSSVEFLEVFKRSVVILLFIPLI